VYYSIPFTYIYPQLFFNQTNPPQMNFIQSLIKFFLSLAGRKAASGTATNTKPPSPPKKEEKPPVGKKEETASPPPAPPREKPAEVPQEFSEGAADGENIPTVNDPLPPIPTLQLTVKEEHKGEKVAAVIVSDGVLEKRFPFTKIYSGGLFTPGSHTIKAFIDKHERMLSDMKVSNSAINVMLGTADNEGNLDAINAYDAAFLSFGIFQWTLGTRDSEGELAALLKKIKLAHPDAFNEYFLSFGLDVSEQDTNSTYGYFTLDGKKVKQRNEKELFRKPEWVFRFWRAGQDPKVQALEIEHALSRLKNFYWKTSFAIKGHTLSKIITSEYGVSLILDNHVNMPGYVRPSIQQAMEATGLINSDPENWESDDERKLIASYLKIRQTFKMGRGNPMTDAKKRGETTTKYRDSGVLSDVRGTFQYSGNDTRSADGDPFAPPAGYQEEEYPEIVLDEPRAIGFEGLEE
jgi:hypothetical protein